MVISKVVGSPRMMIRVCSACRPYRRVNVVSESTHSSSAPVRLSEAALACRGHKHILACSSGVSVRHLALADQEHHKCNNTNEHTPELFLDGVATEASIGRNRV